MAMVCTTETCALQHLGESRRTVCPVGGVYVLTALLSASHFPKPAAICTGMGSGLGCEPPDPFAWKSITRYLHDRNFVDGIANDLRERFMGGVLYMCNFVYLFSECCAQAKPLSRQRLHYPEPVTDSSNAEIAGALRVKSIDKPGGRFTYSLWLSVALSSITTLVCGPHCVHAAAKNISERAICRGS